METETSAPPPEAVLIKLGREAAGLTAEAAAAAVRESGGKISATYWRDVERGYGGRRGQRVRVQASPRTLAQMARVSGVSADRLRATGRPNATEAADILEEIGRKHASTQDRMAEADRSESPSLFDDVPEGELRPYLNAVLAEIGAAIAKHGPKPAGAQMRTLDDEPWNAQEIEIWDNSPFPRGKRAEAVAVLRMITDEALHPGERRAM